MLSSVSMNAGADTVERVELRLAGISYMVLTDAVVRREGDVLVIESDDPVPTTAGTDCRVDVREHAVLNLNSLAAQRIAVYASDYARVNLGTMACRTAENVATDFGRIRQETSE
ncbi:MAG: hypothetical protein ACFHX7_03070 [Pseudomonadota bacterium]